MAVSMLMCRSLLNERGREVLLYLRFLKTVINEDAGLHLPRENATAPIDRDLTHTLKANGYLLIYNLVEATMTMAITDIHRAMRCDMAAGLDDMTLDCLNPALFERVLRRFKEGASDKLSGSYPSSGAWLVKYWLDDHDQAVRNNKNPLASGNLDGQKIVEMAKKYGFDTYGREDQMKHPGLYKAKEKRNALAHGKTSFKDCGMDTSVDLLLEEGVGVLRCLRHHVRAVEAFIAQRGYVRPPRAVAAPPLQPA
ncbi:MAE_28990/MAE_18760 family HEPN-like nuclease [Malikia sp.]|uniref:MAE_28990/MAE_18760 family HEPN-like nuclease n=1 Tax=Malikia sp. TaxID=2070706 RepID=UPI00260AB204|nr:MAE_28990/MAE_18760 family HEPN-like nuclease [Malikia sp.]MDD2728197.1 hypothetical protein [Malikia sp.]